MRDIKVSVPSGWCVEELAGGDIHVFPLHDKREHVQGRVCWCEPRLLDENAEPKRGFGPVIVVHEYGD